MELKTQGNELFQRGEFQAACVVYSDALRQLEKGGDGDGGHGDDAAGTTALRTTLLVNRAACQLKLGQYKECVEGCSKALESDRGNLKALFRKAQAHAALKQVEEAFRDLRLLLDLDKTNEAAHALMKKIRVLATDLNSTTSQTLQVIEQAEAASSEKDKVSKLRSLLATLMEDQHLAKSIAEKGACDKLWAMRKDSPLALKVLSKMSEYQGCYSKVARAIDVEEVVNMIQAASTPVLKDEDDKDDSNAEGQAGDEIPENGDAPAAALNMLWRLLKHSDEENKVAGETATTELNDQVVVKTLAGALASDQASLRRIAVEGTVRTCMDSKSRSVLFVESNGMDTLMSMIARDFNRDEPMQQVSVVLGQVLPALEDDARIKTVGLKFCKHLLESADIYDQIKGAAGLDAIFFANKELGEALIGEEGLLEPLKSIARRGVARAQALVAEVFSHLANSEKGRAMLAGEPTDTLKLLATVDDSQVRSAAAVTLAKLNAIDFDAESENGMLVLSSVLSLLAGKSTKEENAKGVEAVSFVITDSQVKMMLVQGKGLEVSKDLIKLAIENPKEVYAYGLAFIFENLTMSEDDKRREKLREMEVTEEQWSQFEKLTKSETRKSGQKDARPNVELRIKVFVEINGIEALRAMVLESSSERVWEAAARALCNIASVQDVRRQMIAQGGLKALYKLTSSGTDKCKQFAAHALAKIFVTTDPHLLKDEQLMDTIGPLVNQVRNAPEDLAIFECCMALTNLATVNVEAKQKIVNAKGISAFEYAQYSDNLMVRRAATEALNNLIPTEEVIEWICKPEKLKLWLMFAQAYDEDAPTACASIGALANLSSDERFPEALMKQDGNALVKLVNFISSENLDIAHRAVVCVIQLTDSWPEGKGPGALKEAGVIKACEALIKQFPQSPAAPIAKECIELCSGA